MNPDQASEDQVALLGQIAAGDADVAAGFYDAHAAAVREYCGELCPPELVDEATQAAFVDFLGRVSGAPEGLGADELLRRAARAAAASRIDLAAAKGPTCRAIPELIAARLNNELLRDGDPLARHLEGCRACRDLSDRIAEADRAFDRIALGEPDAEARAAWLGTIAGLDATAAPGGDMEAVAEPEPAPAPNSVEFEASRWEISPARREAPADAEVAAVPEVAAAPAPTAPEPSTSADPEPKPEPPTRSGPTPTPSQPAPTPSPGTAIIRRRSGGLVGAARRAFGSKPH